MKIYKILIAILFCAVCSMAQQAMYGSVNVPDTGRAQMVSGTIESVDTVNKVIVISQGKGSNARTFTYSIDPSVRVYEGNTIAVWATITKTDTRRAYI